MTEGRYEVAWVQSGWEAMVGSDVTGWRNSRGVRSSRNESELVVCFVFAVLNAMAVPVAFLKRTVSVSFVSLLVYSVIRLVFRCWEWFWFVCIHVRHPRPILGCSVDTGRWYIPFLSGYLPN